MNNKPLNELVISVFDTETTGLVKPIPTDIQFQPFITELYACKMDGNFNFISEIDTLIKPPIPITPEITKITGISDDTVKNALPFYSKYDEFYDFFHDVDILVGQNVMFDVNVLHYELMRHDLDKKFCWPKRHVCTIEGSYHYKNKRMGLSVLHEFLFGETFKNAHRAKGDVMATTRCFIEMVKRGDITL